MLASFVIGDGRRIRGDRAAAAANLTSRMNTSRCTGHASTVVPDDEVNVDERAVVGAAHDMLERPACPSPLIALGLASRTCAACGSRMRAIGSARSVASSTTSSLPRLCAKSSELGWIRRHPASVSHVATVLRYRDLAEVAVDVERSPGTLSVRRSAVRSGLEKTLRPTTLWTWTGEPGAPQDMRSAASAGRRSS